MANQGQNALPNKGHNSASNLDSDNFVLEKDIFSNIFERDIRRVYIYKKAERLARAMQMVSPAFAHAPALKDRADRIAIGLVDAAILPPGAAKEAMARELLALSSVLSIARTGGLLSPMNAELVSREARQLLQEIAAYETPRLALDHLPSFAEFASAARSETPRPVSAPRAEPRALQKKEDDKGHKGQTEAGQDKRQEPSDSARSRREAILSILATKSPSYIKDISTLIRGVSEKTIQRELGSLVSEGKVLRKGERRWTTYELVR